MCESIKIRRNNCIYKLLRNGETEFVREMTADDIREWDAAYNEARDALKNRGDNILRATGPVGIDNLGNYIG